MAPAPCTRSTSASATPGGGATATGLGRGARLAIALVILTGCMFLAQRFGLVALIANGYRLLAAMFLLVYLLPVLTIGLYRLWRGTALKEST